MAEIIHFLPDYAIFLAKEGGQAALYTSAKADQGAQIIAKASAYMTTKPMSHERDACFV